MTKTAQTKEIARAIERIRPILAGRPPDITGAILANLVAIWLVGHHAEDADATRTLRSELLEIHCKAVLELTEINAKILGTTA